MSWSLGPGLLGAKEYTTCFAKGWAPLQYVDPIQMWRRCCCVRGYNNMFIVPVARIVTFGAKMDQTFISAFWSGGGGKGQPPRTHQACCFLFFLRAILLGEKGRTD